MTYRVIQWSTGNVGRHAAAPHRAPSRARARRPVGAQRRQGGQGRGGAGRASSTVGVHGDERRRRVARARRRLRLLHRDRRPASGRSDRRHGAHRRVGQEHRVELGRAARVPRRTSSRDCGARSRTRARAAGVSCFTSGIDPGWANDLLPLVLTGTVRVRRRRCASWRSSTTRRTRSRPCCSTRWASASRSTRRRCC